MNKKKILVIDDERSITRLLKLNLEGTGEFIVRDENRSGRALAAAREFQPDLIILDLVMPVVGGCTLAEELRADAALRSVPVLVLTAADPVEEAANRAEAIAHLPRIAKPVHMPEILAAIRARLAA